MLSHRALATAVLSHLHGLTNMPSNWICISYLPLAHIYGRVADMLALASGYVTTTTTKTTDPFD